MIIQLPVPSHPFLSHTSLVTASKPCSLHAPSRLSTFSWFLCPSCPTSVPTVAGQLSILLQPKHSIACIHNLLSHQWYRLCREMSGPEEITPEWFVATHCIHGSTLAKTQLPLPTILLECDHPSSSHFL